jgi:glycosyltransferase involved in cell wall biosynthesis
MSAEYHPHDNAEQIPGRCLFVGSDINHNVSGLRWFLENVWPEVLRHTPDSMLHVCGTVCSTINEDHPNVRLLGRVDDLTQEYAAAELCIIPLIVGSGLKIKLVEALSHGRACVSTSIGVQGVPELADQVVLVTDTPKDFAKAVFTVFSNPEKRKAMEHQARTYIIEHLLPEKAYQPFVDRIYRHIRDHRASSKVQ